MKFLSNFREVINISNVKQYAPGFLAASASFGLLFSAQPPHYFPEAAYIFLLPILFWFYFENNFTKIFWTILLSSFFYYVALVGWIRHVTFPGMLATSFLLSLYWVPWFLIAGLWLRRICDRSFLVRLFYMISISSLWVLVEWVRGLFALGFPWCPLSVTQWERPAILQLVPMFGGLLVSFFLVFFNLSLAFYIHHLFVRKRGDSSKGFFNSFCPEFYVCLCFLLFMLYPLFSRDKRVGHDNETVSFKVGVCQPYLKDKWIASEAKKHKASLIRQTKLISLLEPDLIVWPEASTPYAINEDRGWVENLVNEINIPLLIGAVIRKENGSYNCVVKISPEEGLSNAIYAKQILVPFGEYVPYPFNLIPGLEKITGPTGDFKRGNEFTTFKFKNKENQTFNLVPLICYEDIFPDLVANIPRSNNTCVFVTTNDAWFGEEGCAEQHAAHSVIRSLETGLPFLRCGNSGWSGWISPSGVVRNVLLNHKGSVYFSGTGVFDIFLNSPNKVSDYKNLFNIFCILNFFISFAFRRKLLYGK
ncbi:MAG: apolipoprotein N-acyltransferase [Verrucomicrobiota bacterium]|nr:apolipoprotein N-acyltransferase [Verrucomicrobiota bacterium]